VVQGRPASRRVTSKSVPREAFSDAATWAADATETV